MKKKKKWTFFKIILILGILIAIAIYILDRLLPKPYSDEDLDDEWPEEENDSGTGEPSASVPPAADVTYDITKEDEESAKVEDEEIGEPEKKKKKNA